MDQQPVSPEPADEALQDPAQIDPARTLAVLRVIWALLLVGQGMLVLAAAMVMRSASKPALDEDTAWQLFGATGGMLVVNILLGSWLRNQIYKRNWQGNVVKPAGYFFGNILMLAMLESVVMLAIAVSMLRMSFWPWLLPGAAALAVYLVNFPHGGPMFPRRPDASTDASP